MKEKYRIHSRTLKTLVFDNLKIFLVLILIGPFYYKWRNGTDLIYHENLIWILAGLILLYNIPAIFLYVHYYIENKTTEFVLDYIDEKILITQNGVEKEYSKKDISKSTYHLGIYYKNAIDRGSRMPMLISNFGYWDLQFKNGDRFYLTNLLHDFLHDTPKVAKTKYRFRIYPWINKSDFKQLDESKRKREKTRVDIFIDKFQSKSKVELLEIINNKKNYQKEAVRAAEIVLGKLGATKSRSKNYDK